MRKSLRNFVRENRELIDRVIRTTLKNVTINDRDREEWVQNDAGLYSWARSEGVRV